MTILMERREKGERPATNKVEFSFGAIKLSDSVRDTVEDSAHALFS